MLRLARNIRGRYLLAIDLVGIVAAAYLALAMRLDGLVAPLSVPAFPLIVVLLVSMRTAVNVRLGLYSRRWRFASVPELERIVGAAALGSLVAMAVFYGAAILGDAGWTEGFPRSFWPIELLLSITFLGGVRFGIRAAADSVPSIGSCRGRRPPGDAPVWCGGRRRARGQVRDALQGFGGAPRRVPR